MCSCDDDCGQKAFERHRSNSFPAMKYYSECCAFIFHPLVTGYIIIGKVYIGPKLTFSKVNISERVALLPRQSARRMRRPSDQPTMDSPSAESPVSYRPGSPDASQSPSKFTAARVIMCALLFLLCYNEFGYACVRN